MDAPKKVTRRLFIGTTLGVGAGLTLTGCGKTFPRRIVPQVVPSDGEVPGKARYYRSVCRACPAACGLTARVREGRAVKVEGSPLNPIGEGALCATGQAVIDDLYSLHRLGAPKMPGVGKHLRKATWVRATKALEAGVKDALDQKKQIVVLTRPEPGVVGDFFRQWLTALGQDPTQVVVFDAMSPDWLREAARETFGRDQLPRYDLAQARFVLSIGADLLEDLGSPVEHARGLAEMRSPDHGGPGQFVYVGPRLSLTAAQADTFLSVQPGSELDLVLGLCREVLHLSPPPKGIDPATTAALEPYDLSRVARRTGLEARRVKGLAIALTSARPSLCVGPGRSALGPEAVQLAQAVYLLNVLCGNFGRTIGFDPASTAAHAGPSLSMKDLVARVAAGKVGALVIHHADPFGYGGAFASLAKVFDRIPFVAAFGNRVDSTARRAHVVLADHHFLETWDQLEVRPGVRAIQQPVMTPLLPTRAAADVLVGVARNLGHIEGLYDGTFADQMQQQLDEKDIERGGIFKPARLEAPALTGTPLALGKRKFAPTGSAPEVLLVPSMRHLDGRAGMRPLLEEVPDPITTVSWSGWVEVHPKTAADRKIETGDVLRVRARAGKVELPAFVHPGVCEGAFAVPLAYAPSLFEDGGPLGGRVAGARVETTGDRSPLAIDGGSLTQMNRELAREVGPSGVLPKPPPRADLYADVENKGKRRWAMAVDLDRCTGCGACVAACYVENNCPVVGPEETRNGRDMAWLRVQRFIETEGGAPRARFLPVMCQQCGAAPCESVCPVDATMHTAEGLNAQIYNRCVGTRYCGNNCPYQVRRFNWFDWPHPPPTNLGLNPDVTVRQRGVTEKCMFCIQRIRAAEEQAKIDKRPLRDGDVQPACVQTCPTQALVFGDLKDERSRVAKLAADGRAYRLLEELNTHPGVTYLARRRHKERT